MAVFPSASSPSKNTLSFVENPLIPTQAAIEKLRATYPAELITRLSAEKLYRIPQFIVHLEENETLDYSKILLSDETPNVMRGILPISGRVFIIIKYVDESEKTPITRVDTLFQRHIGFKENWAIATHGLSYIHSRGRMSPSDFDYLARLIDGQPCGPRVNLRDEGSKTFRGMSVVHLGTAQQLQTR